MTDNIFNKSNDVHEQKIRELRQIISNKKKMLMAVKKKITEGCEPSYLEPKRIKLESEIPTLKSKLNYLIKNRRT